MKNKKIYYIPYARFTKEFENRYPNYTFKKGDEYPIDSHNPPTDLNCELDPTQVAILKDGVMGVDVISIPLEHIEMFIKVVIPKFKLGDVVKRENSSPFRVFEYSIIHGKVWYRDGWGVATHCESGVHEEYLEKCSAVDSWEVEYYDLLVKEANPHLHSVCVR